MSPLSSYKELFVTLNESFLSDNLKRVLFVHETLITPTGPFYAGGKEFIFSCLLLVNNWSVLYHCKFSKINKLEGNDIVIILNSSFSNLSEPLDQRMSRPSGLIQQELVIDSPFPMSLRRMSLNHFGMVLLISNHILACVLASDTDILGNMLKIKSQAYARFSYFS